MSLGPQFGIARVWDFEGGELLTFIRHDDDNNEVLSMHAYFEGLRPHCDRCNFSYRHVGHGLDCDRSPVIRNRKGSNPAEWPEDLRVREWPT